MSLSNIDIDPPAASLLLTLHLQDLTSLENLKKGKGRASDTPALSDSELALSLYGQELRDVQRCWDDERLARSISRAVREDEEVLRAHVMEEERAVRDREVARGLSLEGNSGSGGNRGKGDNKQSQPQAKTSMENKHGQGKSKDNVKQAKNDTPKQSVDVKKPAETEQAQPKNTNNSSKNDTPKQPVGVKEPTTENKQAQLKNTINSSKNDTPEQPGKKGLKSPAEHEAPEQSTNVKRVKLNGETETNPEQQPKGLKRSREEVEKEDTTLDDEFLAQLYSSYREGSSDMDTDSDTDIEAEIQAITKAYPVPTPEIDQGGSSKRRKLATTTTCEPATKGSECSICLSEYPAFIMLALPCTHFVCKACLQTLFQRASTNEEEFPPRCCETIPLEMARIFLTKPIIAAYQKAKFEYEAADRLYCSRTLCSSFIPPGNINDGEYACCNKCGMVTCMHCKGEYHNGDCPKDDALQELLKTASKKGWKRCYVCERMVELNLGCYHMVCRCGAQFCYRCGKKWKTCKCPKWEEKRLLSA